MTGNRFKKQAQYRALSGSNTIKAAAFLSEIQKEKLESQGLRSTEITMTAKEAGWKSILYAAPFLAFLAPLYLLVLIQRSTLPDVFGIRFCFLLGAILAASTALHELLHGIGWALLGKAGWGSISFHRNGILPSCSCHLVLKKDSYLIGILLPAMVLGSLSCLFLAVCPGTVSVFATLANFTMAGADLAIAMQTLKGNFVFLESHPTKTGFIGYSISIE